MVQTPTARAMASTFIRRVDGMFKGLRSKEPPLWLSSTLFKNVDELLCMKVLWMKVCYASPVQRALIDSKAM